MKKSYIERFIIKRLETAACPSPSNFPKYEERREKRNQLPAGGITRIGKCPVNIIK